MGLLKRFINVAKGKSVRAMENIEKSDPDAIFRAAIDEKAKDIADLKNLARETKGFELKETEEIAACERKLEELNTDLNFAIEQKNTELGPLIIQEIEETQGEIEVNKTEREEYAGQFEKINSALEAAKSDLNTLKKEQQEAAALEKSHKVMSSIEDRVDGTGNDAMSKALENARTRTNSIKAAQASMGATKAASMESKRAVLREKAAAGQNADAFKALLAKSKKKK